MFEAKNDLGQLRCYDSTENLRVGLNTEKKIIGKKRKKLKYKFLL